MGKGLKPEKTDSIGQGSSVKKRKEKKNEEEKTLRKEKQGDQTTIIHLFFQSHAGRVSVHFVAHGLRTHDG